MAKHVHICRDPEALASHARDWLVENIDRHSRESDTPFSIALSGGSTPKRLYQLLGELPSGRIPWSNVLLLWGDERNVPPDHHDSNFRMVRESLLDQIEIPAENVLAVPQPGGSAAEAAQQYEQVLRSRVPKSASGLLQVNAVLLGIGDDVHTASLFPGTAALQENQRWVVENWVEKFDTWRITLTAAALNAAKDVVFLISGEGKRDALSTLWHGPVDPVMYPAQLIQPHSGNLWFMLDRSAVGDTAMPDQVKVDRMA